MNETLKTPDSAPARAHVCPTCQNRGTVPSVAWCPTCRDLGTVPDPSRPGLHVVCTDPAHAGDASLPVGESIQPEPVSEPERAEGDRIVAAGNSPFAQVVDDLHALARLRWAEVDVARDVLILRRGREVECEIPLRGLRGYRHDDLLPRLVFGFAAGVLAGVAGLGVALWLV